MPDAGNEPLLGRVEAATLLAVEDANGGEWAELEQVIARFRVLFGQWPHADELSDAFGLLCEAGLVDYRDDGLELTSKGRKLLRHAGMPGNQQRPGKVTRLLGEIPDEQLAEEGSVPEPSSGQVSGALERLTDGPEGAELFDTMRVAPTAPYVSTVPLTFGGSPTYADLRVPPLEQSGGAGDGPDETDETDETDGTDATDSGDVNGWDYRAEDDR